MVSLLLSRRTKVHPAGGVSVVPVPPRTPIWASITSLPCVPEGRFIVRLLLLTEVLPVDTLRSTIVAALGVGLGVAEKGGDGDRVAVTIAVAVGVGVGVSVGVCFGVGVSVEVAPAITISSLLAVHSEPLGVVEAVSAEEAVP